MPLALALVPAAAVIAWLLLRGAPGGRRAPASLPPGTVVDGLEAGATEAGPTERLAAPGEEDEPFKRHELEFERRPSASGGEYAGPYGPSSGPGGDGSLVAETPAPTQTQTLAGYYRGDLGGFEPQLASFVGLGLASPTQTAVKVPTSLITDTGTGGGTIKAV